MATIKEKILAVLDDGLWHGSPAIKQLGGREESGIRTLRTLREKGCRIETKKLTSRLYAYRIPKKEVAPKHVAVKPIHKAIVPLHARVLNSHEQEEADLMEIEKRRRVIRRLVFGQSVPSEKAMS